MDQDLCLVWLYCVIDGVLRSIGRVRQRGPAPELTDAEVLTIQLWGEIGGLPNDASVWRDATTNLHGWFPNLCNEWNFVRRCGSLAKVMDLILASLFGPTKDWNAFDGLPLPVCRNIRAARDRRFGGEAAWSVCAAKNEMYYGFKAGMLMNACGEISRLWLGSANVDERQMLHGIVFDMPGLLFADKGLISPELVLALVERGTDLVTPFRRNMLDMRPQWVVAQAMRLRRLIETAFSRLTDGFCVARTKGRDFWRWSARVRRKVLSYNLLMRFERCVAVI
jgi:hypothetical protein